MRFDDTLTTVLATDLSGDTARVAAWRQLVDLVGRRRVDANDRAIAALTGLRDSVPVPVRIASSKALEFASPPVELVALIAGDDFAVAVPVVRSATLTAAEWTGLLPRLTPQLRGVLRNRRDLEPEVRRALDSFGSVDLVLPDDSPITPPGAPEANDTEIAPPVIGIKPVEAIDDATGDAGMFRIVDVMARIDAFESRHEPVRPAAPLPSHANDGFQFETDESGTIRWVEGVNRAPLIGLSLTGRRSDGSARVDGVFTGALRRRSSFRDARLQIEGTSDAAGDWRLSAIPVFNHASGRFTGFRGTGRRPRLDQRTEPTARESGAVNLRQLVHELRTPAGAITGFAEMIDAELLGPVPAIYRDRAGIILDHSRELIGVIDDLDLAARIDGHALDLRDDRVALAPQFETIARDLRALCKLRRAKLEIEETDLSIRGDRRAVERLLARLLATLVSACRHGEELCVRMGAEPDGNVVIVVNRPAAFEAWPGESVFDIDDIEEDGTLLGTGFALRLVRNLARELGGSLSFGTATLILRLPAAAGDRAEQVQSG